MLITSRNISNERENCKIHGNIIDFITVEDKYFCVRCAAKKSNFQSWFYTGGHHGEDILKLELEVIEKRK